MSGNDKQRRAASNIRKIKYKKILDQAAEIAENNEAESVLENLHKVKCLLKASNKLMEEGNIEDRLGQTSEVVLDAQVLKMSHDLLTTTLRKIDTNDYSDDAFSDAINQFVLDEDGNSSWDKLEILLLSMGRTVRYSQPMYGSFSLLDDTNAEQSQQSQTQRRRRHRSPVGAQTKPKTLSQSVNPKASRTKLQFILAEIEKVYRERGGVPIPYYEVVIDPTNMMNTFDNLLSLSFMFRDSIIGFKRDENNQPAIYPVKGNRTDRAHENKQFIVSLDNKLILENIKRYKITKAFLQIDRDAYQDMSDPE